MRSLDKGRGRIRSLARSYLAVQTLGKPGKPPEMTERRNPETGEVVTSPTLVIGQKTLWSGLSIFNPFLVTETEDAVQLYKCKIKPEKWKSPVRTSIPLLHTFYGDVVLGSMSCEAASLQADRRTVPPSLPILPSFRGTSRMADGFRLG